MWRMAITHHLSALNSVNSFTHCKLYTRYFVLDAFFHNNAFFPLPFFSGAPSINRHSKEEKKEPNLHLTLNIHLELGTSFFFYIDSMQSLKLLNVNNIDKNPLFSGPPNRETKRKKYSQHRNGYGSKGFFPYQKHNSKKRQKKQRKVFLIQNVHWLMHANDGRFHTCEFFFCVHIHFHTIWNATINLKLHKWIMKKQHWCCCVNKQKIVVEIEREPEKKWANIY